MVEFDNTHAIEEGWVVADCSGSENGPWQIQKIDEQDVFPSDLAAWEFVAAKAREGSAYHKAALEFVHKHNRTEWDCIAKHCVVPMVEG